MPELSRAILVLASFITIGSLIMLLVVKPGTGEFVISVAAVVIGVGLGAAAICLHVLTNRSAANQRRIRNKEEE